MPLLWWACKMSEPVQVARETKVEASVVDTAPPNTDLDGSLAPSPPHPELVRHACVVTDSGEVWCWGAGGAGQLGRGTFTKLLVQRKDEAIAVYERAMHSDGSRATEVPAQAVLPFRATAVAAGQAHTCALSDEGAVYCWGRNMEGQVGPKQTIKRLDARTWQGDVPTPIRRDLPERAISIFAGGNSSCAIGISRTAWCWGDGKSEIAVVGRDVLDLWVHYARRCVLHSDGVIDCIGRALPARSEAAGAVQVVAREDEVCTLDGAGTVRCAGQKVSLPGPSHKLVAGESYLCALVADDAFCWGNNASGQVKPKGPATVLEPVRVRSGIHEIGAGQDAVCASGADEVICWGSALSGQLGEGRAISISGPRVIAVSR